jgi:hypothetical protein
VDRTIIRAYQEMACKYSHLFLIGWLVGDASGSSTVDKSLTEIAIMSAHKKGLVCTPTCFLIVWLEILGNGSGSLNYGLQARLHIEDGASSYRPNLGYRLM